MTTEAQIKAYISHQPEPKRSEMELLHERIIQIRPDCQLWFLDGTNSDGKIVSNPNIGYGAYTTQYANGKQRNFYQIGMSANTTGISIYILGLKEKDQLKNEFANRLGKASVTGYCIKFKTLKDVNLEVLEAAIQLGFDQSKEIL